MPRVIFHVDMDAFFASVEQRDHPEYAGKPLIVGAPPDQRGVVCAASYEARKFGVRSALPSRTAAKLCPQGIFVRPRMQAYREESGLIMTILREATAALEQVFHSGGAYLMAAAILISTFGCANGITLSGARAYYAMSRDGLFFKSVGKLHPKYNTPAAGLLIQAAWTIVLCVSGSYGQLLDYIIFAELVFYILTIVGLFVLRYKRPEAARPYKALGYPVLPALYIAMAAWICVVLLRYKPQYTWPGLVLVLLGIPVYLFWSRWPQAAGGQSQSDSNS